GMNIVLVIVDSLRKDHVGAYGNDSIQTPSLDALAKESLRFTRAYPESIPTLPARRAIHTGLRTWPFRNWEPPEGEDFQPAGWQHIPEDQTTLSEILLLEQDFNTALFSDTHHLFKASMNFQRGFRLFDWVRGQERDRYRPTMRVSQERVDQMVIPGNSESMVDKVRQYLANTQDRSTEEDWFAPRVFSMASEFVRAADDGQPFFLVVDCFDPHEPWDPPDRYVSRYDGPEPIVPEYSDAGWIGERELERMRELYAGEVAMTDRWLGRFLETLDSSDFAQETLLVVLSDHGVALGEHDATGKPFWALWPEVTDIPFLIRHPEGKGAGEASDFFASTHDVAPTILGFLKVEPEQPMDGGDLSVLLEGENPDPRPHFTLGYSEFVWARDEGYAMFGRNNGRRARLYDLANDPKMDEDVAAEHPEMVRRMFDEYVLGDAGGHLPDYNG
ncbi:MAG TPA: sulfatase, partial [Rubrobacteraceae bacterium]